MKTADDVRREVEPYDVIQTHLYNGVMFIAYMSPNGLWWSNWHMGNPVDDLDELCEFVAYEQPDDWQGWVKLRP